MSKIRPKAWGIGLGRTGTTSICDAFRTLGYKRVSHNPTFNDLLSADAAADNGCILYYKFLDFKYPGSKFILTLRDMESWLESMLVVSTHTRRITHIDNLQILRRMSIYETVDFDRDKYVEAYMRHHDDVRRYFRHRPNDLLEMNIIEGDGWEKLCPFLGLPIPDSLFPYSNTRSRWNRGEGRGPAPLPVVDVRSAPTKPTKKADNAAPPEDPMQAILPRDEAQGVNPDRLVYSCVMDNKPKYLHQTLVLIWSLLDLAKVPAEQIVVHALEGCDKDILSVIRKLGVRLRTVKPFAEGFPHCNKLQQLASPELLEFEVAILFDTDTAVVQDISRAASSRFVRARVVGGTNPPIPVLEEVFRAAGFEDTPMLAETSYGGHPTFRLNCNGGLYFLPRHALAALSTEWPRQAHWLIDHIKLLDTHGVHVDQLAFALACYGLGLDVDLLPIAMNYQTHHVKPKPNLSPFVLHYHNNVNASGLLRPTDTPKADAAIRQVNSVIRRRILQPLDNKLFWNYRYTTAPGRGSGSGSRGAPLTYKRRLLQEQLEETPDASVLDIGCGDLEATRELPVSAYTGVDISEEAIRIAKKKRPDWSFLAGDIKGAKTHSHDLVICLDVLLHQPTRAQYDGLLARLIALTRKSLLVSGYNQPPWYTSPITFFYEPLAQSLNRLAPGAKLTIVGGYRDITMLRLDLGDSAGIPQGDTIPDRQVQRFKTPFGVFFSYKGDLITKQFAEFGAHTRNELAMLLSFVQEGDVILDVGAHIGSYTVPLAFAAGSQARVIAVEPDEHGLALLRKNVTVNGLDECVDIVEALVSDDSKKFRQVTNPTNTGATYFIEDSTGRNVSVFSLDELWRQQAEGRPINIVKVDTEGMEPFVLRSGRELFTDCRPILYIEVAERHLQRYGSTRRGIEKILRAYGYAFFRNRGPRNSENDFFEIISLPSLQEGGPSFDCLAIPKEKVDALMSPHT